MRVWFSVPSVDTHAVPGCPRFVPVESTRLAIGGAPGPAAQAGTSPPEIESTAGAPACRWLRFVGLRRWVDRRGFSQRAAVALNQMHRVWSGGQYAAERGHETPDQERRYRDELQFGNHGSRLLRMLAVHTRSRLPEFGGRRGPTCTRARAAAPEAYLADRKPFPMGSGIWLPDDYRATT